MKSPLILWYIYIVPTLTVFLLSYHLFKENYDKLMTTVVIGLNAALLCVIYVVSNKVQMNRLQGEWSKLLKNFRLMRHDFQNNLQVIYSMVQLKKYDSVAKYIKDIKKFDETLGTICNLTNPKLINVLLDFVFKLKQKEIDVVFEIPDDINQEDLCKDYIIETANQYILRLEKTQGVKDIKVVVSKSRIQFFSENLMEEITINTAS